VGKIINVSLRVAVEVVAAGQQGQAARSGERESDSMVAETDVENLP
jgi:hypothetical protein